MDTPGLCVFQGFASINKHHDYCISVDYSTTVFAKSMFLKFSHRAMHFSAKRGLAIACRLSCLSVCDVGGLSRVGIFRK